MVADRQKMWKDRWTDAAETISLRLRRGIINAGQNHLMQVKIIAECSKGSILQYF